MKFITNTHDLEKYLEIKIKKYSSFKNISIDTRKIKKNSLFFAIKGTILMEMILLKML